MFLQFSYSKNFHQCCQFVYHCLWNKHNMRCVRTVLCHCTGIQMWEEMFHFCPCAVTHLYRESWKQNYFRICYFRRWRKCYVCPNIGDNIDLLCNQQIYNTCNIEHENGQRRWIFACSTSFCFLSLTPLLEWWTLLWPFGDCSPHFINCCCCCCCCCCSGVDDSCC